MPSPQIFSPLNRRDFVATLAKTFLGTAFVSGLPLRAAAPRGRGRAKSVIYLYMEGGMSHLETFDPKPENKTVSGPLGVVATPVSGLVLGQSLPLVAKAMNKAALVRSLVSKEGAHERAKYLLHTSYPPLSSVGHPSLGSWVAKTAGSKNEGLPPYLAVGNHPFNAGFFDHVLDPFRIGDPEHALHNITPPESVNEETFARRLGLMGRLGKNFENRFGQVGAVKDYAQFYDKAVALMRSKDLDAFDLTKEDEATRGRYGKTPFGQGVLLARRLVERQVRYVEVTLGGWDTHIENFEKVPDLAAELDWALSALLIDLSSRGLLESTLVVVASEFGRTPRINEAKGRDHHPGAFSALLAGGGIAGGQVWGETDGEGREVTKDPVSLHDLNATIAYALGLDPETETMSPVGRPFALAGGGVPLHNLFS